jgi:putative flippase GtrA
MKWIKGEFYSTVFLKFFMASGVAAGVNFFSRILFSLLFSYPMAIFFAFWMGLTTAFVLNRRFVFKNHSSNSTRKQFGYFLIINLLALLQTMFISLAFAWYILPALEIEKAVNEIAHFLGVSFPIFTSFIGHKYISFKPSKVTPGKAYE